MSKKLVLAATTILGLLSLGFFVAQAEVTKRTLPYVYNFRIKMNKLPNQEKLGALQEYLRGVFKEKGDIFSGFEVLSASDLSFLDKENKKVAYNLIYFNVKSASKSAYDLQEKVVQFFKDVFGDDLKEHELDASVRKNNPAQVKMSINLV